MNEETEVIETVESNLQAIRMEHSEALGDLALALSKAQGSFKSVGKNKQGYGYKYMDLPTLLEASREGLAENELAVVQGHYTVKVDDKPYVGTDTMLIHSSGQWIKSTLEIPIPQMKQLSSAQLIGVVSTYARRYLWQAIVGIASEEDTDGKAK